jgi:hypothetical protein
MGDVIALRIARSRVLTHEPERGADILFFTGVRYERMSELPKSLDPSESRDPPDEPRGTGRHRRRGSPRRADRERIGCRAP